MSWPTLESFIPEPLRAGPIPDDVAARAWVGLGEAFRRHVAKRIHGAEDRGLGVVVLAPGAAPYAFVFDGRGCEAASPSVGRVAEAMALLPRSGMLIRQGGNLVWREALSDAAAARRWRELGGDEAFALEPHPQSSVRGTHSMEAYALVRRGHDRVRVDLSMSARGDAAAWARRVAPFVRSDLRGALGG